MSRPLGLFEADFIDVHYHAGPDAYLRRHGVMEAGRHYRSLNGWVVLKNHLGCSASQAWEARQEGLPVSGSVVLNEIAGGIDFRVVQRSLCHHGDSEARLIVHLPTVTGRSHQSRLKRNSSHWILDKYPIRPLTVSQEGKLNAQTLDVLRMARDYPIVISTGHADAREVRLLVDAAVRLDVPRLMLNQPANPLTGLDATALLELAQAPMVYTEQTALTYLLGYQPWGDFSKVLCEVPRALYSSDLGQTSQPDIEQWQVDSLLWFEKMGLGTERAQQVSKGQAQALLQLAL
ncbi:DUF6282 family protein [Pseudomonas sp. CCNWLW56]|uniref:DUF6282 family protein n=1 Tax=unclassified Pseudomonas TaxID=196821 RepID=UPI00091A98D3|nr:DUF6282 family protein [Pseudomonas sp. NFACC49-2]SFX77752.1 hypothetical protein SAMN03159390_02544 [Pseudomonas sp. NFACC49-2]